MIFVDDYLPNLESVKQLCIKLNINFGGFYYKLEILRFQKLLQEQLWLSCNDLNNSNKKIKYLK